MPPLQPLEHRSGTRSGHPEPPRGSAAVVILSRTPRRDNGRPLPPSPRWGEGQEGPQHRTVFRFAPSLSAASIFAMYAAASGTLQSVSPMSTSTGPIAFAAAFARAVNGTT